MNSVIEKVLQSRVSLAPMAGITDYVLRGLVREQSSSCLLTTEMISSEALVQVPDVDILKIDKNHHPTAFQLSGHKPELMARAAKILEPNADILDINMGCPVNKVVKGNDGSALMRTPELAADIVCAIKETIKCPVSVKFRLGYTCDEMNFVSFGEKMQAAGAEFITLHARTRSQMYGGKADWAKIRSLVNAVDIPIFANGDVTSVESALECLETSGAAGVAVGRGALGDVTLIKRIEHALQTGEILAPPTLNEKIVTLRRHLDGEIALRGENAGIKFVRKFYPYYINSVKDAAKYRGVLVVEENYKKIVKILDTISNVSAIIK